MKRVFNFQATMPRKRLIIVVCLLIILLVVAGVYLLFFARISDGEIKKRVTTAEKQDNCEQGLSDLEDIRTSRLSDTGKKTLLHYRVVCQYKLSQYQNALGTAQQLQKVYARQNDNGKDSQLLGHTIDSLKIDIKTQELELEKEKKRQEQGISKPGEGYDGPAL